MITYMKLFRRLEWKVQIGFEGSGNFKNQKVYIIKNREAE